MAMKSVSLLLGCVVVALALVVPAASEESNGFILLPPDEMKAQQAIMERCQGGSSEWFSVGAMFVAFREALEACVIISVMVNILTKVNMPHFNRFVWWGTGMGMLVSCLCGAGIVAGYYAVQSSLLSYRDKAVFSGTFSLIAALFLTGLAVQFLRFKDVEVKYRRKMAEKTEGVKSKEGKGMVSQPISFSTMSMLRDPELKGTSMSVFALCFAAVIREGLECFVFLAAFASHTPPAAIAIAAVVGLTIGSIFGYVFLVVGKAMRDLRYFLAFATTFMLFISAGLMALTSSAFKTVALIDANKVDTDFSLTTAVYDIYKSTGEGHQTCGFWAVLRAIVGYSHNPSMLWWIVYLVYWASVLSVLGLRYWKGTLFSKFGNSPFEEQGAEAGKAISEASDIERAELVRNGGTSTSSTSTSEALKKTLYPPLHPAAPTPSMPSAGMMMPQGGSPPAMPGFHPVTGQIGYPLLTVYSQHPTPLVRLPSGSYSRPTGERVHGVNFGSHGAGVGVFNAHSPC